MFQRFSRKAEKYKDHTDEDLYGLFEEGGIDAFNEIYARYSKRLLFYFYRMLGRNREKSQDFLHDLFLKIVERPDLFDINRKFSTWVFTVAHNMCKNEYRRMSKRMNVSEQVLDSIAGQEATAPLFDIEKQVDSNSLQQRIQGELMNLSLEEVSTYVLRFQEELPIKDISRILDLPEGTVKSRIFNITKKLSVRLKEFNPRN